MKPIRHIHPHFQYWLKYKDQHLIHLYTDVRMYLLELFPACNEILYHTHALTSLYSISDKLSDAFCMIPIYTQHLNVGFNKGTRLKDPHQLLKGTGKLIRHIEVKHPNDYRNLSVQSLIQEAYDFARKDMDKPTMSTGNTISKIKIP